MPDSRTQRRINQIKQDVPIDQVLHDYGYRIHMGGQYQEQQFPCDLHGDGNDGKASARMYPANNSWYCFACSRTRNVIDTIQAKEGFGFMDALTFIENKYKLPVVPWEDEESYHADGTTDDGDSFHGIMNRNLDMLDRKTTFQDERRKLVAALQSVTELRRLPMDVVLAQWEAIDKMTYLVKEKQLGEVPARMVLIRLYDRLMGSLFPDGGNRHEPN